MDQSNILLEERTLGKKYYELTDHLGNVLATVMDRRTGGGSSGVGTLYSHWKADIATATDYYPFGMMMPGRYKMMNGDTAVYRFGYNGQEKVNEIAGIGNHTTAMFWEYDTRLGRRWNIDPVTYPWQSSYSTFNNNPILFADPLGLFGTRREAREYKKDHDIRGKITKGNDGLYSIDDKRNGVSYTRDNSLAGEQNILGMQEDGVLRSPMITAEGKGSNSNCYTCWMYDSKNSDAFKRASEQGYMPYNPEAVGVTFSANGLYGGGGSFSLSLGISANDGLFGSYSIGGGVGNDVSLSGGFFMADYRGKGRADISGFVNGAGQQNSIGLTALSLSQSSDIFSQDGRLYYGQNWNSIGIGLGVGTRELPMGAVSATSQVTYGQGLSMRSIYNYLKSKK